MAGREVPDGATGVFHLTSVEHHEFQCAGNFQQVSRSGGMIHYHCTDGSKGMLRFFVEGPSMGGGTGKSSRGKVRFLFGYPLARINAMLHFPGGQRLDVKDGAFVLQGGEQGE